MIEHHDVVELLRRDHHEALALLTRLDRITDDELGVRLRASRGARAR